MRTHIAPRGRVRPPRLPHFSYVGMYRYFLTACTFQRTRHFVDANIVAHVQAALFRCASETRFVLTAYCFMPDHLHVLAEATTSTSDLRALMRTAKQFGDHAARPWTRGRLWQPGYYDHILRDDEATIEVARYIVQNPVRAGLVRSCADYPFLGSQTLALADLIASTEWCP